MEEELAHYCNMESLDSPAFLAPSKVLSFSKPPPLATTQVAWWEGWKPNRGNKCINPSPQVSIGDAWWEGWKGSRTSQLISRRSLTLLLYLYFVYYMFAKSLIYSLPAMCDIFNHYDFSSVLHYIILDITRDNRKLTRPTLIVDQGGASPSVAQVRHPVVLTMVDPPGPEVIKRRKSQFLLDYSDCLPPSSWDRKQNKSFFQVFYSWI